MFSKAVAVCVIVSCLYVCLEAEYTGTSYAYVSAANGGNTEQVLTHSAESAENGQVNQIIDNHIYQDDSSQKQTSHQIDHFNPHEHEIEYYVHPKYNFKYGVEDPHTGDKKYQYEERDGDKVIGEYSLVESDGTVRKVYYTANDHDGFRAIVSKKHHHH